MATAEVTAMECIGGWLVAYAPSGGWVSAVSDPSGASASVWLVPGWSERDSTQWLDRPSGQPLVRAAPASTVTG